MEGYKIFEEESALVIKEFSKLTLLFDNNIPFLRGMFDLIGQDGSLEDSYEIEIRAGINYPNEFPELFEIGGKIPKNIDWHIYAEGNCCICSPPEEKIICYDGIDLIKFIKSQVQPYLFNQTFRRKNGYFLKERSHGALGWIEFFYEILKTKNISNIIMALNMVMSKQEPDRTALCFCGSKKKYRHCHRDAFRELAKLEEAGLNYYITELKNYI
ncbi:SEC-C domain-containing protein [Flavobacterium sp. 102]|uniref:SEC-C domain-containing protein n=1 Tax=Flavobacterium sp. 102 TaxID=2135623 RepID=UPI000EACEA7E|nr:SEC-C domain-containing protein [Flavobacterium sp. 102]RKS03588.1 SEC-C motif-containing protein [Flavobacterium sp. 102]